MGKFAVRAFTPNQAGQMVPARQDAAPYPTNWHYSRTGISSLFHQAANERERLEYLEKHTGGGGAGVDEIRLSAPHKKMNLGGMDHVADADGRLRILDSEYWGRAVGEYEQRVEYLHEVARVATMSSEICQQTLGMEFVNACGPGAGAYKGEAMPPALQGIDATPDLVRVLPRKGTDYVKAYAKIMWLLERTSVAFNDQWKSSPVNHTVTPTRTQAGSRSLKEACS